jgi:aspartate/methionine/tyrosine aminotransferase
VVAKRTENITSFIVMDVLEKAHELECEGINVVHLEVGEPDFDTPSCVKSAACKALDDGHTHYTHSLGLLELRESICHYYREHYGVAISADQIIVTSAPHRPCCFSSPPCSTRATR